MPATLVQNAIDRLGSPKEIGLQTISRIEVVDLKREVKWLGTILIEGGLIAAGMHWSLMVLSGVVLVGWAEKDASWMQPVLRRFRRERKPFDGRFFPERPTPVVIDIPAGQMEFGPVAPEEERRRAARREFDTFTDVEKLALNLVSSLGPISEGTLREHLIQRGGNWTQDIPRRLEHLFATHDFNGRFSILPEYQDAVRELTRPAAPDVIVNAPVPGIDPRYWQRQELARFVLQGEQLERRCGAERASDEVRQAAINWHNRVVAFLSENLGLDYAAEFRSARADAASGIPAGFPHAGADTLLRLRGRVACLNRFTRELRE